MSNGKVCVSGGYSESGNYIFGSIEIFDPTTRTFSSGGNMAVATAYHKSVARSDGKVLFLGGFTNSGWTNAGNYIQLYDPSTNTTQLQTQYLVVGRGFSTAVVLNDGRVFLCGGVGAGTSAEILDPISLTSTATSSMKVPRYNHTAILLPDGRVLIAGGWNGSAAEASTEIYNPTTHTWTTGPTMPWPRVLPILSVTPSGKLLVAGGGYNGNQQKTAAIYDFTTSSWTTLADMAVARSAAAESPDTVMLDTTKILMAENNAGTSVEYFDTTNNNFAVLDGPMWYQNQGALIIKLSDGTIFKCGGSTAANGGSELFLGL